MFENGRGMSILIENNIATSDVPEACMLYK